MTLPLERARSRRPITWLTLLGVLLLPVVIGGILVAALNNPVDRLDNMRAAIVNADSPVTVNGQLVPLGRQLTAGLVEGSDTQTSNLDWTISNVDDAAAGLANGKYAAVITIPENFSAAATSTAPGGTPEKATIEVTTAPDSRVVDTAITAQVATAASTLLGQQLSQVYLENVLVGFTTLGDQLGDAATGAGKLADGGTSAADGATQLQSGASQLADGAGKLGTGAGALADGLGRIADGTSAAAGGAGQLADGLKGSADSPQARELAKGLAGLTQAASSTAEGARNLSTGLNALSAQCLASGASSEFCDQLATTATGSAQVATGAETTNNIAGPVVQGIGESAGTLPSIGAQVQTLADGLAQLANGTRQSQSGAVQLQSGATGLQSGASQLADGAGTLSTGVAQLGTGAGDLQTGLQTAVDALPSYTKTEAKDVATVVADPVTTSGVDSALFGGSAIPLLAVLALWVGGLASFIALRAVPAQALESRRPSALLAARALLPAAALGALQGLLVASVAQIAASYAWEDWSLFAVLCAVAGVAFAAVHQALVALMGGVGRWVAAVVGVLFIATGIVSTVPAVLAQIAGLLPTAPAYTAMLGALTPAGGVGPAVVGMLVWAVLAFATTCLVTARRRTTTARAVLSPIVP